MNKDYQFNSKNIKQNLENVNPNSKLTRKNDIN